MERINITLLLFLLGFISQAQESYNKPISNDTIQLYLPDSTLISTTNPSILNYKTTPYHLDMQVSTSVTTDFNGGFGTSLYVSPQLWYMPNQKWQFNITPVIGRISFHDMPVWMYPGYLYRLDGTSTNLGLYAEGSYNVNEKIYVGASVYAEALLFDKNTLGATMPDFNNIGASTFIGYKFSDHFRVEAEFGVNKNPYYHLNSWQSPVNPIIMPAPRNPYNR